MTTVRPVESQTDAELHRRTRAFGVCSGTDSDDWHPIEPFGVGAEAWAAYEDHARELCSGCPVRAECLELALRYESRTEGAPAGVWGGTSPRQRSAMLRRRPQVDLEAAS